MLNPLPCLICGRSLDSVGPTAGLPRNQPSGGTAFSTSGHYGSTFFDSIDGMERLEIAICDDCMSRSRARARVVVYRMCKDAGRPIPDHVAEA